ncbi:hypothetical protein Y032_0564g3535 [Ancylostoma ceylanicum]|uniref:Uncharacterized protein n=1 Tax=Ancylostoma ceylanicum TaxID=53326 RepID=A0A016WRF4_9BILA|nr:hypothetical protein Y032_0564g3535 [Ancylostoma ceylanicum]
MHALLLAGLDRVVCSPLPTNDLPYANVGIANAAQHGNLSTLVYSSDNLSAGICSSKNEFQCNNLINSES